MQFNEYQQLAARTIDKEMALFEVRDHALHGMVAELGELHGIYQKGFQKHPINVEHLKKELGDLLWFIAEYCTSCGWDMDEIANTNIAKLLHRYPDGFSSDRSIHREEGDI